MKRLWVLLGLIIGVMGPSAAQEDAALKKVFEETAYYLKDVVFVDASLGWAVGDVHWDQDKKQYVGTLIHTADGGATWAPQPVGVAQRLNAVAFVDAQNGWAVGAEGTIVHTADGGATWVQQTAATTDAFQAVSFVDAQTGWAATTTATEYDDWRDEAVDWAAALWHTADGGATWGGQPLPEDASLLHGADFVDAQTGWLVGARRLEDDEFGRPQHGPAIYHTADGGATWEEQLGLAEPLTLTAVDFIDPLHGWAVGFPTRSGGDQRAVFHTADGGATWERQEPGDIYAPLWDVQFIDTQRGYIAGANYVAAWGPPVMRTFDGGATWEDVKMREGNPLSVEGIYAIAVVGDRVVAVGDRDYIAWTERAWDACEPAPPQTTCNHCDCLFEQDYLNPHYIFHDVFFADAQHGWAVGSKTFDVPLWGQVILHTADGGETWAEQYEHAPPDTLFSTHRLAAVHFTDAQNGWAVGKSERYRGESGWEAQGAILYTSDGGLTWQDWDQEMYDGRNREFFALDFSDTANGWGLATNGPSSSNIHLAHTTDGGATWEWVDTGYEGTLAIGFALVQGDVDFTDSQHGWAAGGLGQIVHTADGGATWTQQTLTCDHPTCRKRLFALAMLDAQTGWLGGEGLWHTTDSGATWLPQPVEIDGDVQDIQFLDAQTGWLVTDRGGLLYTADGGANWQPVESGESTALRGLHFTGLQNGWLVGDYGMILHYMSR